MLRGFATVSFWAEDLAAAKDWYVELLGIEPYFEVMAGDRPAYQPITERGEGFVTAAVVDPFGNVLGVMYNAHYLEILGAPSPPAATRKRVPGPLR